MASDPDSFSHLEPAERLFVAQYRIQMTSVITAEVMRLHAQLNAVNSRGLLNLAQLNEFANTLENTVLNYYILQLARLWDKFDVNGFSLPTIAALIDGEEILSLIHSQLTHNYAEPPDDVLKEANIRIEELKSAINLVKAIDGSNELKRIRNYRHKHIAHPIYKTREERKKPIETIVINDLSFALMNALRIVRFFQRSLSETFYDYERALPAMVDHAMAFYSHVTFYDAGAPPADLSDELPSMRPSAPTHTTG